MKRKSIGLRSEAQAGRASNLQRSPVKSQHRRDLEARGLKDKGAVKTWKTTVASGKKPRCINVEKEKDDGIS